MSDVPFFSASGESLSNLKSNIINLHNKTMNTIHDFNGATIVNPYKEVYNIGTNLDIDEPFNSLSERTDSNGKSFITGLYKFIITSNINFNVTDESGQIKERLITVHAGTFLKLTKIDNSFEIDLFGDIANGQSKESYDIVNHYTHCSVLIEPASYSLILKFRNTDDFATSSDITRASFSSSQYTYSALVTEDVSEYDDIDYSKLESDGLISISYKSDLYEILEDGQQYLLQINSNDGVSSLVFTYVKPIDGSAFICQKSDSSIPELCITVTDDTTSGVSNKITMSGLIAAQSDINENTKPLSFSIYLICYAKDYIDSQLDLSIDALNAIIAEIDYADASDSSIFGPVNLEGSVEYSIPINMNTPSQKYQVLFDGSSYICNSLDDAVLGLVYLGNPFILDENATTNNLPFVWTGNTLYVNDTDVHTIQIFLINQE